MTGERNKFGQLFNDNEISPGKRREILSWLPFLPEDDKKLRGYNRLFSFFTPESSHEKEARIFLMELASGEDFIQVCGGQSLYLFIGKFADQLRIDAAIKDYAFAFIYDQGKLSSCLLNGDSPSFKKFSYDNVLTHEFKNLSNPDTLKNIPTGSTNQSLYQATLSDANDQFCATIIPIYQKKPSRKITAPMHCDLGETLAEFPKLEDFKKDLGINDLNDLMAGKIKDAASAFGITSTLIR